MKQPLIGITTNHDSTTFKTATHTTLSSAYVNAVRQAGGLPLLIPNEFPLDQLDELRAQLDGLLLTGGGDVATARFNGKDHPLVGGVSNHRDELEIALARLAVQSDWPFLGICRGVQVINVALGGTLYTHIPDQFDTSITHNTPAAKGRDFLAHRVMIVPGTRLHQILGQDTLRVNSFHHQALLQVPTSLLVNAHAEDGLIEGAELPGHRFGLGVQWHPECIQMYAEQQRLFSAFIQAASE